MIRATSLCVTMTTTLALCGCGTKQVVKLGDISLPNGRLLRQVVVDATDASGESKLLLVLYRTQVSTTSCGEIQAEVRDAWTQRFRGEAEKIGVERATVMPEDSEGRSVGFNLVRRDRGEWVERNFPACKPR